MNKKLLLLALIAGTAPLIAQEKPSQILESLMQPLPRVTASIEARAAAFPALRHIPSSACAFLCMADVQDNIAKLLATRLIKAAVTTRAPGESIGISLDIPIDSIAIAFDQGAEANITALFQLANNISAQESNTNLLSLWQKSSKVEYQASFASILKAIQTPSAKDSFKGINKADLNLPEMRIIVTMKPGSKALIAQLKQQSDAKLAEASKMLAMPVIEQDGYTIISLPLAMATNMIPLLPEGSMNSFMNSQHYLALKFDGNCISLIYSHDLKKISAPSRIEQSMLASEKLTLSDARLAQGIISSSFVNATLMNMNKTLYFNQAIPYSAVLQNVFQSLAEKHSQQAAIFTAASFATAQIDKQLSDLKKNISKQVKCGDYSTVLWNKDHLNYLEVYDYQSKWNYKRGKLNAWNQIDKAETISYFSMSPINTTGIIESNFDSKSFLQNAKTLAKGGRLTLNEEVESMLQQKIAEIEQHSDNIKTAGQALCDIYKGTEGSITIYADNKGKAADLCKSSSLCDGFAEGKAPRVTIISAVSDQAKLASGIKALQGLCEKECSLEGKYIFNDKFIAVGNSAELNQSSVMQSSSSKEFTGAIFYFNAKAIAALLKGENDAKETLQAIPEIYAISYPKDGKLFTRIMLK